jgi:sugar lactone lactonase YvrE
MLVRSPFALERIRRFPAAAKVFAVLVAVLAYGVGASGAIPAPQWIGAYDVQGRAGLLWIKAPEASRYKIFRRRTDERTFTLVGMVDANRYTDESIQPRITYFYRLVGVTSRGEESPPSGEISFILIPKVKEAIGVPLWEGHIIMERGIGLKWESLDPTQVVAYNVFRASLPDGRRELLASTRDNVFTDYRVETGREYRYWVTALDNNFKETPLSGELTVTFTPPLANIIPKPPAYSLTVEKTYLVRTLTGGKNRAFNAPADAVLSKGLLFVVDSGNGIIQAFTRGGDYRYDFPVPPAEAEGRSTPLGIAADGEGRLSVTDAYSGRIMIFQPRGHLVKTVILPRRDPVETFGLLDLAYGPDGRLFVVDNANHRIALIDSAGKFVRYFGSPGLAPGQLTAPGFCWVDSAGRLLVSESLGARIQVFSAEGLFQKAFGRYSRNIGCFARPKGVAVDSRGRIYVADSWLCQIQVFDDAGIYLFTLADEKGKPLDLGSPNGILIDEEDNIYITERLANRVQVRHLGND